MSVLFSPLKLGDMLLPNRVIMSPLTRCRASAGRVPNALMAKYYTQRSSAGLIISEATSVHPMGVGYPDTPGIWSQEQVAGWRLVTDAVHAAGGRIFLQLWHVGRVSHPLYLNGELPVAPSALAPEGHVSLVRPKVNYVVPRALELSEIKDIVEQFRLGAANAKLAGFDGVELHGANGYLLDQFLQDGSNRRTDAYGGTLENRARLMVEVVDAVLSVWPASRVGMHLAPRCDGHSMKDSNPSATFGYIAEQMKKRGLAFLMMREHEAADSIAPHIRKIFGGITIANEQFTKESAEAIIARGDADAVGFGKLFIANPDLPRRFLVGGGYNDLDTSKMYASDGLYTEYPSLPL